jgi:hypothetical protein
MFILERYNCARKVVKEKILNMYYVVVSINIEALICRRGSTLKIV